jgi:hypothetical protein
MLGISAEYVYQSLSFHELTKGESVFVDSFVFEVPRLSIGKKFLCRLRNRNWLFVLANGQVIGSFPLANYFLCLTPIASPERLPNLPPSDETVYIAPRRALLDLFPPK